MKQYISITGWSKYHRQMDQHPGLDPAAKGPSQIESGYVIYWWEGGKKIHLKIDTNETVTLKKCAEILELAEEKTGNIYSKIVIDDDTPIQRKKYIYNKTQNRLLIWAGKYDLMPVYENWDGQICRDRDALADCLM